MEDELDPEIAALLANAATKANTVSKNDSVGASSSFRSSKTNVENSTAPKKQRSIHEVDLSQKGFDPLPKLLNDTPSDVFNDTKYYKVALTGENQSAQRVHQLLSKYLTCQDPKDRAVFRQQIVTAYWELLRGMVGKMSDPNVPKPKKMMVRFGVILPSLFKQETKDFFLKIIEDNIEGEPILYTDEWFREIASGRMANSATDEKRQVKTANMTAEQAATAEQSRLMQLQSKNSGKLQSAENLLGIKENERNMLEIELKNHIDDLCEHSGIMGLEPHKDCYSEGQRKIFPMITDLLHRLSKNDKELQKALDDYRESKATYDNVQSKMEMNGPLQQLSLMIQKPLKLNLKLSVRWQK